MKLLVATVALILTFENNVVLGGGNHEAVFKSIHRADRECTLHLRDGTCGLGECSVRCRGLVTRFWNDTLGLPAVTINKFYQPKQDDYEYYELTEKCLNEVAATYAVEDSCGRADYTVQCYADQYGQLDRETPKFVPFTELQHRRILRECSEMLGISSERMFLYRKNGIEYYQDAKCLLRCFMIREGYYTDENGPHFPRMSLQCEGNYNDGVFRRKARSCISKLQTQYLDRCTLAYRIADECVNGVIAVKRIFVEAVKSLLPKPLIELPTIFPTVIPPLTLPTLFPPVTLFPPIKLSDFIPTQNITLPIGLTTPTSIPTTSTITTAAPTLFPPSGK